MADGLTAVFAEAGVTAVAPRVGALVGLFFGAQAPRDYASAKETDEATYARVFHAALDAGVAWAPGAYEILFPALAHTDAVIDEILERLAGALAGS